MPCRKRELQERLCGEAPGMGGSGIGWNMSHHPLLDAPLCIPIRSRFASGSRISISYPQGCFFNFYAKFLCDRINAGNSKV